MLKNILFLVSGMTPQIITETVWALSCDSENKNQWIPDEIHVLSTRSGLNQIKKRLFNDGIFSQLQADYPKLKKIKFSMDQLYVIQDDQGVELEDLKTPLDNEFAANAICEKIREFTSDNQVNLHVSIAGGRKTMGFYAGYALSLFGRAQDRISHVLGDETVENTLKYGMERTFFDERKTSVLKAFKRKFGEDLAKKIEIKNLSRSQGTKGLSKEQKQARQGIYLIELEEHCIRIL